MLLEPHRQDEKIFFTNIFSYKSRKALCEHSYQVTRRDLLTRHEELNQVLQRRGMSLNLDLLREENRTLADSIGEGRSSYAPVVRNLSRVLDDLDETLGERRAG
jgi:hypothetical protein